MKWIALANPQALFAYAVGVVGSHMCFLYTWSRQGSCGVVLGPLLVFLIAPLNLWTTRDPHTSHDTRSLGRDRASEGGFRDNRAAFVVATCNHTPTMTRVLTKGLQRPRLWYCTRLSPAQTLLSQPCRQMEMQRCVLKPINYYYGLCKRQRKLWP